MKKIFLIMAMLIILSSTCIAEQEFPDGTVLNDKEEAVYSLVERKSKYFVEPASIRFKAVQLSDSEFKDYQIGTYWVQVTLSAKNRMGGRTIMTYGWYKNGEEVSALRREEYVQFPSEDVDCEKLNHLWKTYHADDE